MITGLNFNMSNTCPKCGAELQRTKRKFLDKIISAFVSVGRFNCYHYGYGCNYTTLKRIDQKST